MGVDISCTLKSYLDRVDEHDKMLISVDFDEAQLCRLNIDGLLLT